MLVLTRRKGESIVLDFSSMSDEELASLRTAAPVKVAIVELRGDKVRVGFKARKSIAIHRQEVADLNPV